MAKPKRVFTLGQAHASVFVNASKKGSFYTVTAQRRYKDDKGKWKSSSSYTASQLASAIAVMQQALSYILDPQDRQTSED
jgi:hypothetical protein